MICPRRGRGALSRYDETEVCSSCGTAEAERGFTGGLV